MFPSFTGSTRPRRQVNLSGRNSNPFAALPGSLTSSSPQAGQNALAHAKQERKLRQQERERPPAATRIQRTWRGHRVRKEVRNHWRQEWDRKESWSTAPGSSQSAPIPRIYASEEECLSSLRLLVQFASARNEDDVQRLGYFASRYLRSEPIQPPSPVEVWMHPLLRLTKLTLDTLSTKRTSPLPPPLIDGLLNLLHDVATRIPVHLAPYSQVYFRTLAEVAVGGEIGKSKLLQSTALAILQSITPAIKDVYEGFAIELLTTPELPMIFGSLKGFAQGVKYDFLAEAIDNLLSSSVDINILHLKSREKLLWLLAYFIYIRRHNYSDKHQSNEDLPDALYVKIVSRLISFLADDIGTRIDPSIPGMAIDGHTIASSARSPKPLPAFVRSEVLTLINQENVSSLLANVDVLPGSADTGTPAEAAALASYALTLLRAFPRRGDEIRMWLYRGSTSRQSQTIRSGTNLPAIKYFYQAASKTKIFDQICKDPRETVNMLRPDNSQPSAMRHSLSITTESRDQQWRVILLFLELYTFVLKVMDDEEFLSGTTESNQHWSWTRQSALPIHQVKDLTFFLKNLAFAMYWNASEIAGIEATEAKTSLAEYFGSSRTSVAEKSQDESPAKFAELSVAGVSGMTLAYLKGMVTGVLRMVYERE